MLSMHTRIRRRWRPTNLHGRSPQPHPQLQPDATPNLVLGPGGQAAIVPSPQSPQAPPVIMPQNQNPPHVQQVGGISGTSSAIPSNAPLQVAPHSQSPLVMTSSTTAQSSIITTTSTVPALTLSTIVTEPASATTATTSVYPFIVSSSPSSSPSSSLATSAVAVAVLSTTASSATSTPTASPSSSPSDLTSHSPPFYVGVVLGTIVVIACLCALIAWWVRLRSHAKRRRSLGSANVPWGKPDTDGGGLEGGMEKSFVGSRLTSIGDMGLGMPEDIGVQQHSWEPRGDRDVGEPKRSESFLHTPISPIKRNVVLPDPFLDAHPYLTNPSQRSSLADSAAYPLPIRNGPYPTTRPLPSHLASADFNTSGSADDHGSACTLGPLQVANMMPGDASIASSRAGTAMGMSSDVVLTNEFGTPRENVPGSRPRFLGLNGGGLKVPWGPVPVLGRMSSRRRGGGGGNWEHLAPLPMPGESDRGTGNDVDTEGWTASLRTNLVNAFNSVAANLPSVNTSSGEEADKLTPMPVRRGADRKSLRRKDWLEFVGGDLVGLPLSRGSTVSSRVSKAWTLEETGDGAGVVHIRGLESYKGGDHAFSPQLSRQSSLSFDNRDTIRSGTGDDILRVMTHESQTPLIITKKPRAAFLKPYPRNGTSRYGGDGGTGTLTRASSVYSTASAVSSVFRNGGDASGPPRLPSIPSFSRTSTIMAGSKRGDWEKYMKRGKKRPKNLTRLSSSNSTAVSFRSDVSRGVGIYKLSDREEAAKRALKERRKQVNGLRTGKRESSTAGIRKNNLRA